MGWRRTKLRLALRDAPRFMVVTGVTVLSAEFLAALAPVATAVAAPAATGIGYQLNGGNASFKVGGHT
jgi:hypothetical protein